MTDRRHSEFEALRELELPLIVLIGGATGTGKSAVASEVAYRLGITRITSTDFVRQTMRAFFSREFMPSIHYSSFEAGPAAADDEAGDPNLLGFLEQTQNVLVGVKAVLERAVSERHSMLLEGVHLVPGLVPTSLEGAVVAQCLLTIENEEAHESHFLTRASATRGIRPVEKYVDALPEIRRIQGYLVARARKAGVPVIDNARMEKTIEAVVQLVLQQVERTLAPA